MPKGDRVKLKADPEDGATPISNLILEAIAMAKLSGLQRGALMHLCRQTYGWVVGGERLKEAKITLKEWEYALDATKSRISVALKGLEEKNIIRRRQADQWGGYFYSLNTDISKWAKTIISSDKLKRLRKFHICFDCDQYTDTIHEHHLDGKRGKIKPTATINCCPRCHRIRHNKTHISFNHTAMPIYSYPQPLMMLPEYKYLKNIGGVGG